ncbi:MAG: hypothetical protein ACYC9O_12595, partial [Candidatus Latescibacterota bacterium]
KIGGPLNPHLAVFIGNRIDIKAGESCGRGFLPRRRHLRGCRPALPGWEQIVHCEQKAQEQNSNQT